VFIGYDISRRNLFNYCHQYDTEKKDDISKEVAVEHTGGSGPSDFSSTGNELVTPTKLNFDELESLDELISLSPIWYSQTTYEIIDELILQKTAASATAVPPSDAPKPSNIEVQVDDISESMQLQQT